MKNLSRILFILSVSLVFTLTAFSLNAVQEVPIEEVDFLKLAFDYAKFTFLTSIVLAMNHVVAGTFNLKLWWLDTGKPLVFSYVGGLAIAALDIYATSWDFFVESVIGQETNYTDFENLALTGMFLVGFIKGLFKIGQTKEKVARKKAENQ